MEKFNEIRNIADSFKRLGIEEVFLGLSEEGENRIDEITSDYLGRHSSGHVFYEQEDGDFAKIICVRGVKMYYKKHF